MTKLCQLRDFSKFGPIVLNDGLICQTVFILHAILKFFLPLLRNENFKEEKQMTEEKLILNPCTDLNVCLNIK